jgi:hypothetical protein
VESVCAGCGSDVRWWGVGLRHVELVVSVDLRQTGSVGFRSRASSYFKRGQISMDEIRAGLWTSSVDASSYSGSQERYQAAILDQYKLYVEMADRISARRGLTNTFCLTLNTGILAVAGLFSESLGRGRGSIVTLALVVLLVQCAAWFWVLRSYRQLSSAKYRVIGALEERLPASPYWRAEWTAVGSGRDRALYWPLTRLEQWVPPTFALAYLVLFLIAVPA